MTAPMTATERDLRALAGMVSDYRADLPAQGLPMSLLSDLASQIRCDAVLFEGLDSKRQGTWFAESFPADDDAPDDGLTQAHWQHYWDCRPCSYPDRTGDVRSVIKIADFYSAREWHSTGMYSDLYQPQGIEHELMLTLPARPAPPRRTLGPGRTLRLFLFRGPGADFSEVDCALLTLLRPHLHQAYLDAERRRHLSPSSRPGTGSCLTCSPPGTPTRRLPAGSACPKAPSARTWKISTVGCKSQAARPRLPAPSVTLPRRQQRPRTAGWPQLTAKI
jgi:hypothetical protein